MQNYEVTGVYVSVSDGLLRLTPQQASARAHALVPEGKNLFRVISATGFKRGEVFGYSGQINKQLASEVEEVGKKPKAKEAAANSGEKKAAGISLLLGKKKASDESEEAAVDEGSDKPAASA